MGGIQQQVMKMMMMQQAEKNDFDTSKLQTLHRQSVVFGNEFENIQNDFSEHFTDMRKKTLTTQEVLRVKARNTMTMKETSEVSSDKEYSDCSYNRRRGDVILTLDELQGLNKQLSSHGMSPVDMSQLGRMTQGEAELLRQISKNSKNKEQVSSQAR